MILKIENAEFKWHPGGGNPTYIAATTDSWKDLCFCIGSRMLREGVDGSGVLIDENQVPLDGVGYCPMYMTHDSVDEFVRVASAAIQKRFPGSKITELTT